MANQNGRPIAPARKLIAAVLGTIAVFVVLFGVGLASWAIVVLGLVMLALSIVLAVVNVARRGARAWVAGTAQVKAVSDPPVSSRYGRAELQLVVVAPGLPVTEVLAREPRVPVEKWPRPGMTVPVQVDVDDMRRVRIDWATAPDNVEPPPPGHSYDAAYPDPQEEFDDDLLGDTEPPPWATASRDWARGPDEPLPPPPGPIVDHGPMGDPRNDPIIVHDTPAGAVLEGRLVDQAQTGPLPRRPARSGPIPAPSPPADGPEAPAPPAPPEGSATPAPEQSAASSRPAGSRPSPHPRRPASASAFGTSASSPSASGTSASGTSASGTSVSGTSASGTSASGASVSGASAEAAAASAGMAAATATVDREDGGPGPSRSAAPPTQRSSVESPPTAEPTAEPVAEPALGPVAGSTSGPVAGSTSEVDDAAPAPESAPPGQGRSIDIPLDDFVRPAARWSHDTPAGAYAVTPETAPPAQPEPAPTTPQDAGAAQPDSTPAHRHTNIAAGAYAVTPEGRPRSESRAEPPPPYSAPAAPEPISREPISREPIVPEPIGPEPVAPEPIGPEPVAPEPLTPRPVAPQPVSTTGATATPAFAPLDPDIDIPLDGDPEPAPETRPDAKPAVAAGIMAPPAESIPAVEPIPPAAPPADSIAPAPVADSTIPAAPAAHPTVPAPAAHSTAPAAPADSTLPADSIAPPAAAPSPAPEVPPGEPSVITGVDQPPTAERPRGHWADLEGGYDPDERTSDVITAYPSARPGPSAAIHGVGILVLVTDLERSVAFYRDVLGFFEIDGGPGSAVLASGDTRVVLRTVYEVARDSPRVIYLNLEVGDIDAVYEELKAKGVEFAHAPRLVNQGQKLELWSATFKDPDRHNIAISQWRAAGSTAPHG